MKHFIAALSFLSLALIGCTAGEPKVYRRSDAPAPVPTDALIVSDSIPQSLVAAINADSAAFFAELSAAVAADTEGLLVLVDKAHPLSPDYEPNDLVSLSPQGVKKPYLANREGLSLRVSAEKALERMARAALADGVTLIVSSSYRSYAYQKTVYERNVRELGQAQADRESARPGTSQHQLGTAADFGSITDEFAATKAGRWMAERAGEWGWSLSFPDGYESVTGYRWESWHWRYVGKEACALQKKRFAGVQQYMMEFIGAWRDYSAG